MSSSSVFCFSFIFVIYSISYVYIYASFKCIPYLASNHTLFSQMMLRLDFASSQLSIEVCIAAKSDGKMSALSADKLAIKTSYNIDVLQQTEWWYHPKPNLRVTWTIGD